MGEFKLIPVFAINLLLAVVIIGTLLSSQSNAEGKSLWDLELDKETNEISKSNFKAWMDRKGFQSFRYLIFKRDPKNWRIAPCLNNKDFCLVMEDRKSSSHILRKLNNPIPLSDNLILRMEFMVEVWPEQTDLSKKDQEDAALRIFLTANLDGRNAHIGFAVTRDHEPGQVMASQRKPKEIKYIALAINTKEEKVWQRLSTPIAASLQKAFGSFEKAEIIAIGLKSDGNNTGSDVKVWLRELKIKE
jgi:hypothetical protein